MLVGQGAKVQHFCTAVHSFPQLNFQISLVRKNRRVYRHAQIEPGSLKNLTAQLKEGAAAARLLRPQSFCPRVVAAAPSEIIRNNLLLLVWQSILSDFGEVWDALFASVPYSGKRFLSWNRNWIAPLRDLLRFGLCAPFQ